jgi:xanthine dehydrogenase accessory factor
MKPDTLAAIQADRAARRPVILATRLSDAAEARIYADRIEGELSPPPEVMSAAQAVFSSGQSGPVESSQGVVFLHAFLPAHRLVIVGAVHIAQALAPMATMMDLDVTVIDPRRAFASDARFPGVHVMQDWPDEALEQLKPDSGTAVVTLTHDPKLDDPALEVALKSDAFYVGALGSRRTHAKRKERLAALGIGENLFARIHGPVGLNIGAKSPAEIAVSILGQIIETRARIAAPAVAQDAA